MKYRYYVIDLISVTITGTNDEAKAFQFRESEEHLVIDAETAKWILDESETQDIEEIE